MSPPRGESLHPRNRHRGGLDFARLRDVSPALAAFILPNGHGSESIDFADPEAQKALTRALLATYYGVRSWDIPPGYLCPSIPGRADYLHYVADLLAASNGGAVPRGPKVRVLDIGTGANCVYPLIGAHEYGWRFTGAEIDPAAVASANRILGANAQAAAAIEVRLQSSRGRLLEGVVRAGEKFDLTICNPPFHASPAEAAEGSRRKWKNLGKGKAKSAAPVLNFGGQGGELWCAGGEVTFVRRLIEESARFADWVGWFTSLVSKSENLPILRSALRKVGAVETKVVEMKQGQKASRILAWTYRRA